VYHYFVGPLVARIQHPRRWLDVLEIGLDAQVEKL
jgi:hypothetical protein